MQGADFKAVRWAEHLKYPCQHFSSIGQLLRMVRQYNGTSVVVIRYQNSQKNLLSDLKHTVLLSGLCLLRNLFKVRIVWVMHNIDKETRDTYPALTKFRRAVLRHSAERIFVTDRLFKQWFFQSDEKVDFVSFGEKRGGAITQECIDDISALKSRVDFVVLCIGASGPKYLHFERLHILEQIAEQAGKTLGFVVSDDDVQCRSEFLVVDQPNLDEARLAHVIDFVYRINDDVSMPYTVYSACTAGIPIVTSQQYFTHRIVDAYGIGFSEDQFASSSAEERAAVRARMKDFLDSHQWDSLGLKIQ